MNATPCYVQLGRFGDLMILLPAMKHLHDTTGVRPVVMACAEFATVMDGCSYVQPWPVEGFSWFKGVGDAVRIARSRFSNVTVPKWWDCPGMEPPPPPADDPFIQLSHLGRDLKVPVDEWDSYQFSQWKACGFTKQQLLEWPLVFDRRNPDREAALVRNHSQLKKPCVLYNFSGISNPLGFEPEIISQLLPLRERLQLIDLSRIHAHRIYDLLGLYDQSLCLITGDTATLHLACASKIPTIALLANGGAGSIPKCSPILTLRYHEVLSRLDEIRKSVESLL